MLKYLRCPCLSLPKHVVILKNTSYLFLIVALSLLTGFFWGSRWEEIGFLSPKDTNAQAKLSRLMRYVDQRYVDSLNIDSLSTEVIQEIIDRLDPHSVFIPKEEQHYETDSL